MAVLTFLRSAKFFLSRIYPNDSPDPHTLSLPWEKETEPIKNILRSNAGAKEIVVLIGPEGGISEVEAGLAKAKGFHSVSRINILRTETAAIAVLSMILYETGSGTKLGKIT